MRRNRRKKEYCDSASLRLWREDISIAYLRHCLKRAYNKGFEQGEKEAKTWAIEWLKTWGRNHPDIVKQVEGEYSEVMARRQEYWLNQ